VKGLAMFCLATTMTSAQSRACEQGWDLVRAFALGSLPGNLHQRRRIPRAFAGGDCVIARARAS